MCVVCGLHIKSKILWPTHLQSRKHKDSVAALKGQKSAPASAPVPQSRKVEEEETTRPLVPSGKRKLPDQSNVSDRNDRSIVMSIESVVLKEGRKGKE